MTTTTDTLWLAAYLDTSADHRHSGSAEDTRLVLCRDCARRIADDLAPGGAVDENEAWCDQCGADEGHDPDQGWIVDNERDTLQEDSRE